MKVKVASLVAMLQKRRTAELNELASAKEAALKERRRELAAAVTETEQVLRRMKDALRSKNGKVLGEFRLPHLYSARNDYARPKESTVERALRVLSLTSESEITLAEATRLVGDALKL